MDFLRLLSGTYGTENTKQDPQQSVLTQYPLFGLIALFVMFLLTQIRVFTHGACEEGEFEPGFFRKQVVVDGKSYCSVVYVPPTYDPSQAMPLIVSLHGRGEAGYDGYAHTTVGVGTSIRNHPEVYSECIVVMPQFPWEGSHEEWFKVADAAIADVVANYTIDEDRISLTGLSFGAENVWLYAAQRPGVFAALMPIASGISSQIDPADYLDIPIWVFHGAQDFVAPPQPVRDLVQAIQDGGGDVLYTEFPEYTHFIWNFVYQDPVNIDWLISQDRNS
ncbi:MAG: hypothetical protein AMXMBFR84_29920 [Candidatus Hydrogenedentota bacterium]